MVEIVQSAEIVKNVTASVMRISRKGVIYLKSNDFDRDIQLGPSQVRHAGFKPGKVRTGNIFVIDLRIEKDGNLKVSKIDSLNEIPARPPGQSKK